MITQSFDHIIPPMANGSYYGSFTKALVELIVADVPFISLDSAATDTTATYDCTLAMSFDEATKIRFRNQSNAIYCSAIVNGTETSAINTTSFYAQYSEIVKILVGTDVAVVLWSTNGNGLYSENFFIFGRVSNVYDANYGTLIPLATTGTSLMRVAAGNGTAYNLNIAEAYPTPLGVWGGGRNAMAGSSCGGSRRKHDLPVQRLCERDRHVLLPLQERTIICVAATPRKHYDRRSRIFRTSLFHEQKRDIYGSSFVR